MKRDEQALLYQFKDEGRIAVVEKTLHRLGIKTRLIPPDAYQQKVGYLLGRKGFRPLPAEVDGLISLARVTVVSILPLSRRSVTC